jgi:CRP-like cAMP-binding protein
MTWREAVEAAVKRRAAHSPDGVFSRQDLLDAERAQILSDCGGGGETPDQTISRVLQELRDDGVISFVDDEGTYRLNG